MSRSPNQKHNARLNYEGEIRFGPSFYRLEINGTELRRRIFGDHMIWSDDSMVLAAQEWLTTDYVKGPITRVLLIDVEPQRVAELEVVEKGFVEDFIFRDQVFIYRKSFKATGQSVEAEVQISDIVNWKPMVP
jgi:hypothetical protein